MKTNLILNKLNFNFFNYFKRTVNDDEDQDSLDWVCQAKNLSMFIQGPNEYIFSNNQCVQQYEKTSQIRVSLTIWWNLVPF